MPTVDFRLYEELNRHLPPAARKRDVRVSLDGPSRVGALLQGLGVPPAEVDLLLVDGEPAGFGACLRGGERVAVFPVFERFDIGELSLPRRRPLRRPRFVADVHLSRLARYLRLTGFDCLSPADADDAELLELSLKDARALLSKDRRLLAHERLQRAWRVRAVKPRRQLLEVIAAFQLEALVRPFTRCLVCSAVLVAASAAGLGERVPRDVRDRHPEVWRCPGCERVYWPGGHHRRMLAMLVELGLVAGNGSRRASDAETSRRGQ